MSTMTLAQRKAKAAAWHEYELARVEIENAFSDAVRTAVANRDDRMVIANRKRKLSLREAGLDPIDAEAVAS